MNKKYRNFITNHCNISFLLSSDVFLGIETNVVKPLPQTLFAHEDIESAFGCLHSDQNGGKIVIQMRIEKPDGSFEKIFANPKLYFDPNKSFLLIGKAGNMNLEIADWLIRRGATKVVINSQKPSATGYQAICLRKWSMFDGVKVEVYAIDANTFEGSSELISKVNQLGTLGGKHLKLKNLF